MLETAALYIVIAIGKKLLDHAGSDAGDAFDTSLGKLARWVKQKVVGNPTGDLAIAKIAEAPSGKDGEADRKNGSEFLTIALQAVTAGDPVAARELAALVAELKQVTPPELVVNGTIDVEEVMGGTFIAAMNVGESEGKTEVKGSFKAVKVTDGLIIGALNKKS
jgi:hypothetical protein